MSDFWWNRLPQYSQGYGLVSLWINRCVERVDDLLKLFPHCLQENCFDAFVAPICGFSSIKELPNADKWFASESGIEDDDADDDDEPPKCLAGRETLVFECFFDFFAFDESDVFPKVQSSSKFVEIPEVSENGVPLPRQNCWRIALCCCCLNQWLCCCCAASAVRNRAKEEGFEDDCGCDGWRGSSSDAVVSVFDAYVYEDEGFIAEFRFKEGRIREVGETGKPKRDETLLLLLAFPQATWGSWAIPPEKKPEKEIDFIEIWDPLYFFSKNFKSTFLFETLSRNISELKKLVVWLFCLSSFYFFGWDFINPTTHKKSHAKKWMKNNGRGRINGKIKQTHSTFWLLLSPSTS